MINFIEQDNKLKVEEMEAKTEEEYHITKGDLIQTQRIQINQEYNKKTDALLKNELVYHILLFNYTLNYRT
jgi:hypothetical protein